MSTNTPRPASIEQAALVSVDHIAEELQRYDAYMRDLRGLLTGSRSSCLRVAHRLLRNKFGDGAVDISRLQPADVREFLACPRASTKIDGQVKDYHVSKIAHNEPSPLCVDLGVAPEQCQPLGTIARHIYSSGFIDQAVWPS